VELSPKATTCAFASEAAKSVEMRTKPSQRMPPPFVLLEDYFQPLALEAGLIAADGLNDAHTAVLEGF
jgi:hypothetical protein